MMMQGYVNQNYEAMLSLVVRNGDKLKSITAVIDTGFTGFLSLPIATIRELELSWSYRDRATLGDGSEVLFDIYDGMVIWGGQYREIAVIGCKSIQSKADWLRFRSYRSQFRS